VLNKLSVKIVLNKKKDLIGMYKNYLIIAN